MGGSQVERKRQRLSEINCSALPQENPKEIPCDLTKECFHHLVKGIATLREEAVKKNKIIKKASQQNRMLAQANSRMLAELTSSKDRLKKIKHELVCTNTMLHWKKTLLDEKEALNKKLMETIRVMEERSKLAEVAISDRHTLSEKLNNIFSEEERVEQQDVSIASSLEKSCNPSEKLHISFLKKENVAAKKAQWDGLAGPRKRKRWSADEEDILREAVDKCGAGNWALIKSTYAEIFLYRSQIDLKDKWRNMIRK